jgi:predicted MFS family arabinose efflux permease
MLITLAGIFTVGNIMTAIAPTMGIAIVGRIITSFNHGAFLVSVRLLPHRWSRLDARQVPLPLCFQG